MAMMATGAVSTGGERDSGLTLLEVLVAMAILASFLVAAQVTIAVAARGALASAREEEALSVARSLLSETGVLVPLIQNQASRGKRNGFTWETEVSRFEPGDGSYRSSPVEAYRVTVRVGWRESMRRFPRQLVLRTIKLGRGE